MKKILALVLAVLMLTSVAFAASNMVWKPTESTPDEVAYWHVYPGAKISVASDLMDELWDAWANKGDKTQKNKDYFNVIVTFESGEDLVKDMYWDGSEYIVELKDYNEITDSDKDVVVKSVEVRLKKDSKIHFVTLKRDGDVLVFNTGKLNGNTIKKAAADIDGSDPEIKKDDLYIEQKQEDKSIKAIKLTWGEDDITIGAYWDIGYDYNEISEDTGYSAADDTLDFSDNFVKTKWMGDIDAYYLAADNATENAHATNTPFYKNDTDATVTVTGLDLVQDVPEADFAFDVEFALKPNQWFMMTSYENGRYEGDGYEDMEEAYEEMIEEAGADYAYLFGFEGSTLKKNATMTLGATKDAFIYSIDKEGKLSESGFKWDEDNEEWTKTTKELGGCYVLSDVELKVAAAAEDTTNPDTGANDVIGIASALAVVAVISAAAISLKK